MNSILYDLYYGKEIPFIHPAPHASRYKSITSKIEEEERYFSSKLSDDKKRFNDFVDLIEQASGIDEADIFSNGFKLGAMLMLEVMGKDKEIS